MKMSSRGVWLFPVLAAGLCLARQPRADVRPLSVSATLPAQRSAVAVPDEDAAILSSILRKQFYGWQHAFVLRRETLPLKQLSDISSLDVSRRGLNADAVREAIQDFKRRNAASHTVPALDIGKPLKVVAGSDIDKIFEHHWWEDFYKKYPHTDGFSGSFPARLFGEPPNGAGVCCPTFRRAERGRSMGCAGEEAG